MEFVLYAFCFNLPYRHLHSKRMHVTLARLVLSGKKFIPLARIRAGKKAGRCSSIEKLVTLRGWTFRHPEKGADVLTCLENERQRDEQVLRHCCESARFPYVPFRYRFSTYHLVTVDYSPCPRLQA